MDNNNKCAITFSGNGNALEKFEQLKEAIIQATEQIDSEATHASSEPQWWLEMMDLQSQLISRRSSIPKVVKTFKNDMLMAQWLDDPNNLEILKSHYPPSQYSAEMNLDEKRIEVTKK